MTASYSLITTCVKRWDFLARSLPTWLALPGRSNIFVVSYEFDSIPEKGLEQAHVIVVKADEFHRTRALNLGAMLAKKVDSPEYLLFTDADILIRSGSLFSQFMSTGANPDYLLDSRYALGREGLPMEHDPEAKMRGIRGTHWVRSDFFFSVGGFNQHLSGWGHDDVDLYSRYQKQSKNVAFYDRYALFHQPHPDAQRTQLQQETPEQSMLRNREIAKQASDPQSWAAALGYPAYEIRKPTG